MFKTFFYLFFFNEGVFTQKLNVGLMSWTISNTKKYIVKKNRPHLQKRFYFRNQNEKRKSKLTAKITPGGECSALESIPRWGVTLTPVEPVLVPGCSVHSDKHTADTRAQAETLVCNEISY